MLLVFQLVQIVYWLALSAWFGGVLFIILAGRVIIRTVEDSKPVLPDVLAVNLDGQHGSLLGGTIVGNVLTSFTRLQLGYAGALAVAVLIQWFLVDIRQTDVLIVTLLRSLLLIASASLVVYDWRVLWPKVWKARQAFIEHADEPDTANPALDEFNRHQQANAVLLFVLLSLLLGMVLFSAGLRPAASAVTEPSTSSKSPG